MDWYRKRKRKRSGEAEENALETAQEHKERWVSIRVIYFTMFLMSLGFSIILTGVWPYLDKLDPAAGKEFMGYIVGANPLGQMLFSPLVGWWSNRLGSVRIPLLFSLAMFTFASGVYSALEIFTGYRKYWMLGARFLVGVSSANIAVCRSYLSAATTLKERTGAVSMVSLAQVLGFVVGPGLQAAVTPLGNDGMDLIPGILKLNMYTAAGWINVVMGVLNFIMFLPAIFHEHRIAAREAMINQGMESEEATWKQVRPDYVSAWTLISAFFVLVFNFVLLETLGTSLTMDQFAWSKTEALYYMGILMSVGAVVACVTFVAIGPLCKRFPERKVLLWGGFFFMVIGRALYIPWGSAPPKIAEVNPVDEESVLNSSSLSGNETEVLGCPSTQTWCKTTPAMTLTQFLLGYAFTAMGYPIGVTLIQTIFSKILGPRPQGVWMGLMTGSGCLSRVMGPVFVSYIYTRLGTIWTFGITTVMMALSMVWLQLVDSRLVVPDPDKPPAQEPEEEKPLEPDKTLIEDKKSFEMKVICTEEKEVIVANGNQSQI
ncbi:major facilitator superfamily domain-containing protein 8 [Anabrus simplex]|uniref:major facilitator superfamily domain-containing protein 8 n=1 Tax=Anabrus simplex TaxID=316456 RepID=UPI0035A3C066